MSPHIQKEKKGGFTFLELLVVAGIIALLASAAFTALPQLKKRSDLNSSAEVVASLLSEARARTLASEEESRFGVYFQADRAVFFKGAGYATSSTNIEKILPNSVSISAISLQNGTTSVVFNRLTGDTSQYGTITIWVKEGIESASTSVITVGSRGTIKID